MSNYYFIGIKGSGMSSLALMMANTGHMVSGSDVETHYFTEDKLVDKQIPIYSFEDKEHILKADTIICGNAFPDTHSQIQFAKENNKNVVRYHQFLGEVANRYQSIAVTGTHGKTTTTGMLAQMFSTICPSGYLIGDGNGFLTEDTKIFTFEACEYRNHFHAYTPDYAIITNVDFDHPDFFADLNAVKKTFAELGKKAKKGLVVCGDDTNARAIDFKEANVTYYGLSDFNDTRAENVIYNEEGIRFDLVIGTERFENQRLPFFGEHMLQNSLAAITVATKCGVDAQSAVRNLALFGGVARRFCEEEVGTNIVIDDYAHHPKEIEVTLRAIRQKYANKQLIALFQPHTFSRTEALLDEFAVALSKADTAYVLDIFSSAREKTGTVSSADIVAKMTNGQLLQKDDLTSLKNIEDSIIVFMGAGNINELISDYKELKLKQ